MSFFFVSLQANVLLSVSFQCRLMCCFLFHFTQANVLSLFESSSLVLTEQFCRLLNSVSSLSHGRSYLSHSQPLVGALCRLLVGVGEEGGRERGEEAVGGGVGGVEGSIGRNALGAVQKLSLK